jgi:dTDP-4-amino-4,6-dideoxygalactose transaminase
MNIPFLDLKEINLVHEKQFMAATKEFLHAGKYILGEKVAKFERAFAPMCEQSYCVGLANGLDALILGLEAFKFEAGAEVIVPANTYFASVLAIYRAGLNPILVEPNIDDYLIDTSKIENAITKNTRAILAVNLYGKMCDFDILNQICKKYDLKLIVDAAQSHGAKYKGYKTCKGADAIAYSFYPTKNLGALSDAGVLVSDNLDIYENIKIKRNYGSSEKYIFEEKGINSRLSELQASFLLIKLKYLPLEITTRRALARLYLENIKNKKIILPPSNAIDEDSWHLFVVRTENRKEFTNYLTANGIGFDIHYPIPPHKQRAFSELSHLSLPITEKIHETIVSLPLNIHLSEEELMYIVEKINAY